MKCRRCGAEFDARRYEIGDDATKCPSCGAVYRRRPQQAVAVSHENRSDRGLVCPHCGSRNVNIQFIQDSANTVGASTGVKVKSGCLAKLLYICSFVWLLKPLWKLCTCWFPSVKMKDKRISASHTKIKNKKMLVCNNCGYSKEIK